LSGRGLCDELITRPEESYRLCCVVVCDLETSRMGAPYIYDISHLRVKNAIVLKYVTVTSDNTGTGVSWQTTCWLPLLLDVVTFVSSLVVLTPNGRCLGCSTVAFSERYTGDVKQLPWPSPTGPIDRPKRMDSKTSAIDRSVCLVSSTCRSFDIDIYIDIFVNCNWADIRWQ